jgi:hypothetical protein
MRCLPRRTRQKRQRKVIVRLPRYTREKSARPKWQELLAEGDRGQKQDGTQQKNHKTDKPATQIKSKWPTRMNHSLKMSQ